MLLFALVACVQPKVSEALWTPLEPIQEPALPPALAAYEATPDECLEQHALKPGKAPPVAVVDQGLVACRAQAIPDSRFIELLIAEDDATYFEAELESERRGREADRRHAQTVVGALEGEVQVLTRENRTLRPLPPLVFAAAFLLGAGLALGAVEVGRLRAVGVVAVPVQEFAPRLLSRPATR